MIFVDHVVNGERIPSPFRAPVEFTRASGDCVCTCGMVYRQHAYDRQVLDYDNRPFLIKLCDDRRVKL